MRRPDRAGADDHEEDEAVGPSVAVVEAEADLHGHLVPARSNRRSSRRGCRSPRTSRGCAASSPHARCRCGWRRRRPLPTSRRSPRSCRCAPQSRSRFVRRSDEASHDSVGAMALTIEPFTIDIPEADLVDLRERLARTRFSQQLPDAGWDYGTERGYLEELVAVLARRVRLATRRGALNSFEHFLTEIDGTRVHFLPRAVPGAGRVAAHRHPRVARLDRRVPRRDRPAVGPAGARGRPRRRVPRRVPVDPRLRLLRTHHRAGMGPAPDRRGVGHAHGRPRLRALRRAGRRLGLDDLDPAGPRRSRASGRRAPQHDRGPAARRPRLRAPAGRRAARAGVVRLLRRASTRGTRRSRVRSRRPSATRSTTRPPGWRRGSWRSSARGATATATSSAASRRTSCSTTSCCTGSPPPPTPPGGSTTRPTQTSGFVPDQKVEVPIGFAAFPKEIIRSPRHWAEQRYDIRQWTEMPRGGHFAAFEEGDLLVADVREFFRPLRVRT